MAMHAEKNVKCHTNMKQTANPENDKICAVNRKVTERKKKKKINRKNVSKRF